MVGIIEQVQKLEAGKKVELIEIDCTEFNGDFLRFHNYEVPHTELELRNAQTNGTPLPPKSIMWQGQEYHCWPYVIEGLEMDSTTTSPTPTLTVANIDGVISALCLELQNLFKAKVTVRTTFQQYLDGEAEADVLQEFTQIWYVSRKSSENSTSVSFDLSSPADLTGRQIPVRQIHSVCQWALDNQYRGPDCGYTGTKYFDKDGNVVVNPAQDVCGGLIADCKKRFGAENELSFGGFIGSSMLV